MLRPDLVVWAAVGAVSLLIALPALSIEANVDGDEFYESCDIEDPPGLSRSSAHVPDYSCFVSLDEMARDYELVVDVTRIPNRQQYYVADAHKIPFSELLHKPWARRKRILVLDEGLSTVEAGRRCARLLGAGFGHAKILLGGLRAYLEVGNGSASTSLSMLTPAEAVGPLESNRARLLVLEDFRDDTSGSFDWRAARRRVDDLEPSSNPEQFMPLLLVGAEEDYWTLDRQDPLPWWVYFLEGGEAAYQESLKQQRAMVAGHHVKLRKCAAR